MQNTEFQAPPSSYSLGGNYDPNAVDQERVVLLQMVIDRSGSTAKYENEFNAKLQEFIEEEKKSHIAEEVFIQIVSFGSDVTIDSGWQPLIGFDTSKTLFKNSGDMTAGYDAVKVGLESMLSYGKILQRNGTDVRYNQVVITDGDSNDGSDRDGSSVRPILQKIRNDEALYGKFTIFMYGVQSSNGDVDFEKFADNITLDRSAILRSGATGADFKKMLASVSQSVSKSSSGSAVPNF
jgi:uncharacterized protein YegL